MAHLAAVMWVINRVMLSEPVFGAYTVLFTGLSSDVQVEDTAAYLIPWGRIREHKGTPRHDFIRAGRAVEEVGVGFGVWCEVVGVVRVEVEAIRIAVLMVNWGPWVERWCKCCVLFE
jgi:hypothetical protein